MTKLSYLKDNSTFQLDPDLVKLCSQIWSIGL